MRAEQRKGKDTSRKRTRALLRTGLALWLIQTLLLTSGALLLMFCDTGWVDHLERYQLVRNFMANPVEMLLVEAFGVFCIVVGITGLQDKSDSFLDAV